jgi:hypothetical protein
MLSEVLAPFGPNSTGLEGGNASRQGHGRFSYRLANPTQRTLCYLLPERAGRGVDREAGEFKKRSLN